MRLGAPQAANERNVTEERDLVIQSLHVLSNQATKHYRLAIPDDDAGGQVVVRGPLRSGPLRRRGPVEVSQRDAREPGPGVSRGPFGVRYPG